MSEELVEKPQGLDLKADDLNKLEPSDELNQYLSVEYLLAHDPWDELPWFYHPSPALEDPPPFIYGFGLGHNDIFRYALQHNLCDCKCNEDFDKDVSQMSKAYIGTMQHIRDRFNLHGLMRVRAGAVPDVVLTFWDNHCTSLHRYNQVMDALDDMEEVFGPPKWYLANEDEIHQRRYELDLSKLPP